MQKDRVGQSIVNLMVVYMPSVCRKSDSLRRFRNLWSTGSSFLFLVLFFRLQIWWRITGNLTAVMMEVEDFHDCVVVAAAQGAVFITYILSLSKWLA